MPNAISALILTMILLFGVKSGYAGNPLLNFGILAVIAYILSVCSNLLSLPALFAYIAAGVIAGSGGLGVLHESFSEFMFLIESFTVMYVMTMTVSALFSDENTLKKSLRLLATGALSSFAVTFAVSSILKFAGIPLKTAVIFGLFAGSYSPFVTFGIANSSEARKNTTALALGGFLASLFLWGMALSFLEPDMPNRIRMSFMPLIMTATSFCIGFIWLFITERYLFSFSEKFSLWQPFVSLLLLYPCFQVIGIDYLTVGVGAGLYLGLISEKNYSEYVGNTIPTIIIFGIFGARLPLSGMFLLTLESWKTMAILIPATFTLRILIPRFLRITPVLNGPEPLSHMNTAMVGPLAVLLADRFLHGFSFSTSGESSTEIIRAVLTGTTLILIAISALFFLVTIKDEQAVDMEIIDTAKSQL